MRMFDLTNVTELHDVFPKLTPAQFETAILFCLRLSQDGRLRRRLVIAC
ncbi:hypothetical protein [Arsenophonus sp.]